MLAQHFKFTVRLLGPGHLKESWPITALIENKSSQHFFISWPIMLKDLDNTSPNKFESLILWTSWERVKFFHWLASIVMFERFQMVGCWLNVIENILRIVCTRYISYKLTVNVNFSKMAFAQKIQVILNWEGNIYSNSRQHS